MRDVKTPTLLGIITIVVAIFATVLQIKLQRNFSSIASPDTSVNNVTISNITDSSVNISWTTEAETFGLLKWGIDYDSLSNYASSNRNVKSTLHKARLTSLKPLTTYLINIYSNGEDSGGSNFWNFTTLEFQPDYLPEAVIVLPNPPEESS